MAIINEDALIKEIQSKRLSKVYFVFGNDQYLKQYYCEKISSLACTGDPFFNLQKFEANCDLQEVYDAVNQYPMMADSKFVGLYDYDFVKCDKDNFDKLCKIISEVDSGCVFLLRMDTVPFDIKKDSRAKKIAAITEKNGGKVVLLDHRSLPKLVKMLVSGASKRGCTLSENDAKYLIEKSGEDIYLLRNELEKLCAFKREGTIDKSIIDNVCVKTIDSSLYDYATHILSGNLNSALKLLDDMFFMRVEPMAILYSVSSVYVDIYRLLEGQKSSKTTEEIAKDFDYGNRAFVLNKTMPKARKFDSNKINKSFEILLNVDKSLKSFSGNDRLILEKMTVDLFTVLWSD